MKHLVHMIDGTKQVLEEDAFKALPPSSWSAAEPADRPRHITNFSLTSGGEVQHSVVDRETGEVTPANDRNHALQIRSERHTAQPTLTVVKESNP